MKNTIKEALENIDFSYQITRDDPHQTVLKMGVSMECGRADSYVDIRPEQKQVIIYTIFPTTIPEPKRKLVSDFITRANFGLIIGNFELDMQDGQIRYKSAYFYDDTFPNSGDLFIGNLFATFNMMEKYLPGIMSIVYANARPEDVINQIENVSNPSLN